jgi:uncharacterized surface protein with fasciclin (FAS1) repeats
MSRYIALPRAIALAVPVMLGAWTVQAADIIETAEQAGRFDSFLQLVEAAGMVEMLKGEGPFTVFAPTDEGVGQLPPETLERLLAAGNRGPLEAVIQSHIVADAAIRTRDLLGRAVEVATLGGGALAIDGTTTVIMLVPIEVTITEVDGQAVVAPDSAARSVSALVVKAPPDSIADADGLATLAGQELIGVATLVEPDIEADNGVIHGIDRVLMPPDVLWSF